MSSTEVKAEVSNDDDFGVHRSTSGDEEKHGLREPSLVPTPDGQTVRGLKSRHIQFLYVGWFGNLFSMRVVN